MVSENVGYSHQSHAPAIYCDWGNPNLYLDQLIMKGDASQLDAMQVILWLFSSLQYSFL